MADISQIKLPNNVTYDIKDINALPLTGGSVTGPVSFGDSVSIDEATIGDLVVNGSASFTNNLQANTINGVEVGSNPKFIDTVTTATTTGSGNAVTAVTASNGALTITKGTTFLTGSSTLDASKLSGTIPSAVTATTQASTDNSTKIATTAYVTTAIANLPEPMVFKGSVGTGGTITSLPTAAASNEGHTYKVITALSSPAAKVGDTVISNGSSWVVIPSGDEPGTVTSVAVSNGGGLSVSGSPITSSGTITISHADTSSQASSSNSGRTYIQSLTLDTYGHVTGISTATETVINTDIKLQVAEATSATQYYPLIGTGTTAATRQYDTTGFKYKGTNGTTSAVGSAALELGNSTASGTANNKQGQLILYGSNAKKATITVAAPSADIALALPTSAGTLALTSQIKNSTASATTGITASTTATKTTLGTAGSVTGVQSTTTTASKVTLGTAFSIAGVSGSVSVRGVKTGDNSTTTASKVTVGSHSTDYGVKSAGSGSFTQGTFTGGSLVVTNHVLSFTPATHGADSHTHTAPTLGSKVPTVSASDITVPIRADADTTVPKAATAVSIPNVTGATDVTVPIKNASATSIPNVSVASATVSITDPGHTHTI